MLHRPAIFFVSAVCSLAAVVGVSTPAQPITAERIASLPKKQQAAWKAYLDRSIQQRQADRAVLQKELKAAGLSEALVPPNGSAGRSMPMQKPAEWYAGPEARRIADIVVSFQTPAGGWGKNLNLADHVRRPGESFASNNVSHYLDKEDFDAPHDPHWNYVGTLDNDGTTSELQFLIKVIAASDPKDTPAARASFLRGIEYLLTAQFPNGGWPQVWPLEGGYHDAITFNDGAVTDTIQLLQAVGSGDSRFGFVPQPVKARAKAAVTRGIQCILATQIIENGKRSVWGQQHDAFTLRPVAGRNYEPAVLSGAESANIMIFLMNQPHPTAAIRQSVEAAAAWFKKTAIYDQAWGGGADGRKLRPAKGQGPLWARFYAIGSDTPVFGDRDKTVHDSVDEISSERRNGYSWYNSQPKEALDVYAKWSSGHLQAAARP